MVEKPNVFSMLPLQGTRLGRVALVPNRQECQQMRHLWVCDCMGLYLLPLLQSKQRSAEYPVIRYLYQTMMPKP